MNQNTEMVQTISEHSFIVHYVCWILSKKELPVLKFFMCSYMTHHKSVSFFVTAVLASTKC